MLTRIVLLNHGPIGEVLFGVLVLVAIVVAVVRYRRYGNLRPGKYQVNRRDSYRNSNNQDPPSV